MLSEHYVRETAKLAIRRGLARANLGIGRDPYIRRVARALSHCSVETVLDVGANVGQFAVGLRSAGYLGLIHSYEPTSKAFARLERRAARDPSWFVHQMGLGASQGIERINISKNSYSSSILDLRAAHRDAAPDSTYVDSETIRLSTVADQIQVLEVSPEQTLLKCDTQGFESQVLTGARDLIDRFAAIQLELSYVELYAGQALAAELSELMTNAGLQLWCSDPGIADEHGQLLQADVLFVRPVGS